MKDLKDIQIIYFIGIGGIGMSALARYFKGQGKTVSGYDKTPTPLTRQLESEGIAVHYSEDLSLIPRDADLVIYTPAVPKEHAELVYYQQHEYPLLKRSEVLGLITAGSFNICVAGTHGKTTISTMIAHILRHSGYGCNAFLGGISVNYDSNFWSDTRNVCVVEADEYDRSFLRLHPDIAVISAMDPDHLDIYGTAGEVEQAFIDFSAKIKSKGLLVHKIGLKRSAELKGNTKVTYGIGKADVFASEVRIQEGSYVFNVQGRGWSMKDIVLHMGGMHNVENVTAAIAVAHHLGIAEDKIRQAVAAFRGVKRRFEYVLRIPQGTNGGPRIFIDDYAHHPEELRALITGAKGLYPNLRCTVIFQPHLFTRTRDFAEGFAASLELADEVYLLPIYPARELPIEGVTSGLISSRMKGGKAVLCDKQGLLKVLTDRMSGTGKPELVITAGAGDIDALVGPLKDILEKKTN